MRYRVTEDFTTPTRRFTSGMEVDAADLDGPVPIERWIAIGKIEELPPEPVEEPPAAEPDKAS